MQLGAAPPRRGGVPHPVRNGRRRRFGASRGSGAFGGFFPRAENVAFLFWVSW